MTKSETIDVSIPAGAYELAVDVAREAGAILRQKLALRREIDFKGLVNLVTDADRASEAHIAARLGEAFPDFRMIGEEGSQNERADDSPYVWIFDPLDGTTNYAHGYPHFAVSIALHHGDRTLVGVIYDPMRDELFAAQRGDGATLNGAPMHVSMIDNLVGALLATGFSYDLAERALNAPIWTDFLLTSQGPRRDGAAALNLAYVAAGRLDGFWEKPLEVWDMAAGGLLVEEAGGRVTNYEGGPFDPFSRECIATNGPLHQIVLDVVQRHQAPAE